MENLKVKGVEKLYRDDTYQKFMVETFWFFLNNQNRMVLACNMNNIKFTLRNRAVDSLPKHLGNMF